MERERNMRKIGKGMQAIGFSGPIALGCIEAAVLVVVISMILCCATIIVGSFLVKYEIYLKRERRSKRICRENKKSA